MQMLWYEREKGKELLTCISYLRPPESGWPLASLKSVATMTASEAALGNLDAAISTSFAGQNTSTDTTLE